MSTPKSPSEKREMPWWESLLKLPIWFGIMIFHIVIGSMFPFWFADWTNQFHMIPDMQQTPFETCLWAGVMGFLIIFVFFGLLYSFNKIQTWLGFDPWF